MKSPPIDAKFSNPVNEAKEFKEEEEEEIVKSPPIDVKLSNPENEAKEVKEEEEEIAKLPPTKSNPHCSPNVNES